MKWASPDVPLETPYHVPVLFAEVLQALAPRSGVLVIFGVWLLLLVSWRLEGAKKAGVSKADAERTIGAFFDQVTASAKKDEKVAWPGFGSFSLSKRAARTGRNPQTGAAVKIKASKNVKFTASSTLKAALNPSKK